MTVVAIFAVWANRLLLDPQNWSTTSTRLLDNPTIRTAVANYLVDELYASAKVSGELRSQLPADLQPLALPLTGALRAESVKAAELVLTRPLVRRAWASANRSADAALVAVVEGGGRGVSVTGGVVTLDLRTILGDVVEQLGLPADIGTLLPASAARLVIMRSDQVRLIQTLGRALSGLATILYVAVPLLYLLVLLTARQRRRALRAIGLAGVTAGLAAIGIRALLVSELPTSLVSDVAARPVARAVVSIATTTFVDIAGAVILIGAVMFAGAWVAGPAWPATRLRRALGPHFRDRPAAMFAAAALLLLAVFVWQPIPATGEPLGMLVFTVLAAVGVESLRRQSVSELRNRSSPPRGESASP